MAQPPQPLIMRKFLTLSFLLAFCASAFSQIYNPVKWSFSHSQLSGSEYKLVFTATIEPGWYVYSQYIESDEGPVKTSFNYEKGSHFSLESLRLLDASRVDFLGCCVNFFAILGAVCDCRGEGRESCMNYEV